MSDQRSFHIRVDRSAPVPVFHLIGIIDEQADLSLLGELTDTSVVFDLSEVRRLNSFGVSYWLELMRTIPGYVQITFDGCSSPIVDQLNLVEGFRGHARIRTFQAPLVCDTCDEQLSGMFNVSKCTALGCALPPTPCPSCDQPMEIDDLEEHYLHFLRTQVE